MKRTLIQGTVLIALVCATVSAAYLFGYRRGFDQGLVLDQKGVFVGTFDALQKLRGGDAAAGTRRIEKLCFAAADEVYAKHPETKFVAMTFLGDFKQYRKTYRHDVADWSVTEQHLDRELADLK